MIAASRLRAVDTVALSSNGLRSRPTRVVLAALGIAIGIAAMIAVIGISTSSQARLAAEFDKLGTNLLTVTAGTDPTGKDIKLPTTAMDAVERLPGVNDVSSISQLKGIKIYRNEHIDKQVTSALGVAVADPQLLKTLSASLAAGTWLNAANSQYPTVVLGAVAADRLGVTRPGTQILVGDTLHTVVGILNPVALVPAIDTLALVGAAHARTTFEYDNSPTMIFERSDDANVDSIRELLPAAANPENPGQVAVSRPSDALAAKHAADQAFTGLLVGVGSVALLVGGIGVANTMIISVLERRREIGLRRALGATRRHIQIQFLTEALLLSLLGGVAGVLLGIAVTVVFAAVNGWVLSIPIPILGAAVGATLVIGAIAGLYPALRAARLPPTEALASA